jgi:hypothetical protein
MAGLTRRTRRDGTKRRRKMGGASQQTVPHRVAEKKENVKRLEAKLVSFGENWAKKPIKGIADMASTLKKLARIDDDTWSSVYGLVMGKLQQKAKGLAALIAGGGSIAVSRKAASDLRDIGAIKALTTALTSLKAKVVGGQGLVDDNCKALEAYEKLVAIDQAAAAEVIEQLVKDAKAGAAGDKAQAFARAVTRLELLDNETYLSLREEYAEKWVAEKTQRQQQPATADATAS